MSDAEPDHVFRNGRIVHSTAVRASVDVPLKNGMDSGEAYVLGPSDSTTLAGVMRQPPKRMSQFLMPNGEWKRFDDMTRDELLETLRWILDKLPLG